MQRTGDKEQRPEIGDEDGRKGTETYDCDRKREARNRDFRKGQQGTYDGKQCRDLRQGHRKFDRDGRRGQRIG